MLKEVNYLALSLTAQKRWGLYLTLDSQTPELNRPGSYGMLELEKALESN